MSNVKESNAHIMSDVMEFFRFMLAGKAVFTAVSRATGERRTFRINRVPDFSEVKRAWFVGILTSGNDEYHYHGMIRGDTSGSIWFSRSNKSRFGGDSIAGKAWDYIFKNVVDGERIPPGVDLWHEGKCGRCGRALTVPESIRNGIGPECATKE
jgi:hypothetical protein